LRRRSILRYRYKYTGEYLYILRRRILVEEEDSGGGVYCGIGISIQENMYTYCGGGYLLRRRIQEEEYTGVCVV